MRRDRLGVTWLALLASDDGFTELDGVSRAYAIKIRKSQGLEFPTIVIPLATQDYLLLQRLLLVAAGRAEG